MTDHEIQTILLRRRPGTDDDHLPEVREALAATARNPALQQWARDHDQLQGNLRSKLRNLPTPAGLREQILSEVPQPGSSSVNRRQLLLAGALTLLAAAVFLPSWLRQPHPETRFATFRSRMVRTALRGYAMDQTTASAGEIRRYLTSRQAHGDWAVVPGLDREPLMGCAVLTWRDQPATMICYGAGSSPTYWLFVVDAATLPDPPEAAPPTFAAVNRLTTASWTTGGKTYILAADAPRARLEQVLAAPRLPPTPQPPPA